MLARGLIGPNDLRLYKITDNVDEAVREVTHFYSNYHSAALLRDEVVLRLHRRPTRGAAGRDLGEKFADIKVRGEFRVSGPLPVERDEPALANLHRLVFAFNRRDHGRLRMLIDFLNDLP